MLFVLIHILPGLLVKHAENVERLQSVILAKATITITVPQMIQIIPWQDLVITEQVLKTNLLRLLLLNVPQVLKKQQLSSVSVFVQNWWLERWMDPVLFHTDCLWKLFSPQVVGIYSSCITNKCKTALAIKPTGCSRCVPLDSMWQKNGQRMRFSSWSEWNWAEHVELYICSILFGW